jgi:hypothetical protein
MDQREYHHAVTALVTTNPFDDRGWAADNADCIVSGEVTPEVRMLQRGMGDRPLKAVFRHLAVQRHAGPIQPACGPALVPVGGVQG